MAGLREPLGHGGGERDHVVLDFPLDFQNALDVEAGVLAQFARGLDGDFAQLGQGLGGRQLHLEPGAVLVLVAPDAAHFRPGVSRDHNQYSKTSVGRWCSAIASLVNRLRPARACWAPSRTISG